VAPHSSGEVRGAISQAQVRWRTFGPDGAPIRLFRDTFRDRRCFRDPQLAFQEAVALQALGEWRAACACAQRQSLPSHRLAADRLISSQGILSQLVAVGTDGSDQPGSAACRSPDSAHLRASAQPLPVLHRTTAASVNHLLLAGGEALL
jgi:hypothetical protein